MSYGRVNKPRFYPDAVNWLASRGWSKADKLGLSVAGDAYGFAAGSNIYQIFDLNPLNTATISADTETDEGVIQIDWTVTGNMPITFVAILNHNFATADVAVILQSDAAAVTEYDGGEIQSLVPVLGCETHTIGPASGAIKCTTAGDGDLIATCVATNEQYNGIVLYPVDGSFDADITIGSIIIGSHYTMPNSGEMGVGRPVEFDGVRVRTTDGGKRYGHASWIAGNDGNAYAPFKSQTCFRRPAGRRCYDIDFEYIADTDLFSDDPSANASETDFFYNVPNKTAGPLLPFIWTPDSTSTTEGDYMFARLMNDFKPTKIANNVYRFTNRIEEEL